MQNSAITRLSIPPLTRAIPIGLPPVVTSSHPSPVRSPDELVKLQLEPGIEAVPDHPPGEPLGREEPERGREEDAPFLFAAIPCRHFLRVPVIFRGGDDELHLVPLRQVAEVLPQHLPVLAGGRALHVHDLHRPRVEPGKGKGAVRLHEHFLPVVVGVRGIAISASEVAPGEPYEGERVPGIRGFPLDAGEDFRDLQHSTIVPRSRACPGPRAGWDPVGCAILTIAGNGVQFPAFARRTPPRPGKGRTNSCRKLRPVPRRTAGFACGRPVSPSGAPSPSASSSSPWGSSRDPSASSRRPSTT